MNCRYLKVQISVFQDISKRIVDILNKLEIPVINCRIHICRYLNLQFFADICNSFANIICRYLSYD